MQRMQQPHPLGVLLLTLAMVWGVHAPAPAQTRDPVINEFVFNHVGTDFNEYVEIFGIPNTDYFNVWVLSIEGDSGTPNPGTIDAAFQFGTSDANGLVTTLYQGPDDIENGTNTLLLVTNFTGTVGADIDTDNDGSIDRVLWDRLLDSVAVTDVVSGDLVYSPVVLAPGFDGVTFTVGGASRIPNGSNTNSPADWVRNDFDAEGIPGFNGSLIPATEALNTPAVPNRRNYASGGGSAPAGLRIHDIQGITHRSPFEGQTVTDVEGVVTAIDNSPTFARGFYMQDPTPDSDLRTSEGIFVLTGATNPTTLGITIGSSVQVDGVVEENRPAASVENLTITRIRSIVAGQVTVLGPGTAISPTVIGSAGRQPPTSVISRVNGYVEDTTALNLSDGLDFYESLEGMLLEVRNALAVFRTNDFGEVWVVGDNGNNATGLNDRGGITISEDDFNPERIQIDDGIVSGATAGISVGDVLGTVIGVLSYDFENFELDTLGGLVVQTSGSLTPEITTLTGGPEQLVIASFNVENLDPGDDHDPDFGGNRIAALANIIVNNLGAPDILALVEVQDNNGATDNGTVMADQTFEALIDEIENVDPDLTGVYAFAQIDPEDGQDGGEPGGNIRVGYLYRIDRVQLAPGTPGDAVTNTTVQPGPTLSRNPGRLLDTNLADGDAFASSRKPLVAEFLFNGTSVFVIANHFNSKGGDQPLFGPSQPPALISEAQRRQQAQIVNDFVDDILAEDRNAHVVVLGDLNDFPFSEPLNILRGTPGGSGTPVLTDLVSDLPLEEQYTFNFEGNFQALDNILVSRRLQRSAAVDIVHVNSEFVPQASDHDAMVALLTVVPNQLCSILGNDRPPSLLDQDIFRFIGTARDAVTVTLAADPEGAFSAGRATLTLVGLNAGALLFRVDRTALPNVITATLPATGDYEILVAEQPRLVSGQQFRGAYCLTVEAPEPVLLEATNTVE